MPDFKLGRRFCWLTASLVLGSWLGSSAALAQVLPQSTPQGTPQSTPQGLPQDPTAIPLPELGANDSTYKLDVGDKIKINIFNQPDLSGEFQLDGEGRIFLPLIGSVDAGGLTAAELEKVLVGRYKPDYLVNPRIFIQVGIYKPYYLVGEVAGKGAFPYVAGMTYLTAIANAGGYSYRAKQDYVYVTRADDPEQKELKLSVEEKVQPGDIIRVAERLF